MKDSHFSFADVANIIYRSKRRVGFITNRRRQSLQLEDHKDFSQYKRILVDDVCRLLTDALEKMKASLVLPHFLTNFTLYSNLLKDTPYAECLQLSRNFLRARKDQKTEEKINLHLVRLIDYFHEHTEIIEALSIDWKEFLTEKDTFVLEAFSNLIERAECRLNTTAVRQLEHEKRLHRLYHDVRLLQNAVDEKHHIQRRKKICVRWKQAARLAVLAEYQMHLNLKRAERDAEMRRQLIADCEHIKKENAASLERQEQLKIDLEATRITYERLVTKNRREEKKAMEEKNKYIIQLQTNLQKYDETVLNLYRENMALEEEYKRQKLVYEQFMIEYAEKEAEYMRCYGEKAEIEQREYEERVKQYLQHHAARVIQRYWREYMERTRAARQSKKSKGKGKGKGKTKSKK